MISRIVIASGLTFAAFAGAASAQDFNAPPNYGSVSLETGFQPDPYTLQLASGGDIDVSRTIGGACAGYVTSAPDFSVSFGAGSLPLYISVQSASDTTLVVNDAGGNWFCDDDSGGNLNPRIVFSNPGGGRYDIWVGSYEANGSREAVLSISEIQ